MDDGVVFDGCGVPLLVVDQLRVTRQNKAAIAELGDLIGCDVQLTDDRMTIDGITARVRIAGDLITVIEVQRQGAETASNAALTAYERRLATQRALGRALSNASSIEQSMPHVLSVICGYDDWAGGGVWLAAPDGELRCHGVWNDPTQFTSPELQAIVTAAIPKLASGLLGGVIASGRPKKIALDPNSGPISGAAAAIGMRRALGFPIFSGDRVSGVVGLISRTPGSVELPERGLLDSAGQMLGLFVERMRAQERLQQIVDTLHEGIIIANASGQILYFNQNSKRHHGFAGSDQEWAKVLADPDAFESFTLDGEPVPPLERPTARLRRGETIVGKALWVVTRKGKSRRAIEFSGTLLPQHDGTHITVLALSDITARVELNTQLEQRVLERTSELAAANEELEAFTLGLSHDLRAPVRAITSFSQTMLEDFKASSEATDMLQRVHKAGLRLGQLVDDLLQLSRLGRQPLRLRHVDVTAMVEGIVGSLVHDKRAVVLHPLGTCVADPSLLEQVWTNLIDNAVKYSSKREHARIEIGRVDEPDRIAFSVEDNGVGFDEQYAQKLFGVFQRLHSNEEFTGTGVGLANVRRIVERHGGTVSASSKLGVGSRFSFALPRRELAE